MAHDKYGEFWSYMPQEQKDLVLGGEYLMNDVIRHGNYTFADYSFLVFPYAKAYEGFLKKIFNDTDLISHLDYISDHLRIGKLLSPHLIGRLGERSLYKKLSDVTTKDLAERVWMAWKTGRNQVFHYFPHNLKAISFEEAEVMVGEFIATMEEIYTTLKFKIKSSK